MLDIGALELAAEAVFKTSAAAQKMDYEDIPEKAKEFWRREARAAITAYLAEI